MVFYQCTHAASCHPDWRAKEKFWKVVQRKSPQLLSKHFTLFLSPGGQVVMEQDKENASTSFVTNITRSLEHVVSIFHSTGRMKSGSFTSTEQQMHLTESHGKFSPVSYGITILRILFGNNAIHTKPT